MQARNIHHSENQKTSLSGKRVIILGGTSGLGLATAEAAAQDGAAVVVASSSRRRVDSAIARLPEGAEGHLLDLSDEEKVREFFDQACSLKWSPAFNLSTERSQNNKPLKCY